MSKSFTTTVSLSNENYVIENDSYFNAKSIAINPKAALIIPAVITVFGVLGYGTALTVIGSALNAIFDTSLPATAIAVTGIAGGVAGLNHYVLGNKLVSLESQHVKAIYDSFHFTYDVAKIKAFGNPEINEKIDTFLEDSITTQPINQIDMAGELPNVLESN